MIPEDSVTAARSVANMRKSLRQRPDAQNLLDKLDALAFSLADYYAGTIDRHQFLRDCGVGEL